ncbi:ABC transporter permease [Corynebacterium kozikiae]|uniref:ABC transporter permease n=1 Tax=Corynebacterium kozikiae TaxID=2968469 RepID=UPI00211BE634|nr:ABC transporter permease [Corynebacterium sp. 76QC2CO]MCQ9344101.1 ABC transporter permease [Corynebacterium sp. 76QC2CO]
MIKRLFNLNRFLLVVWGEVQRTFQEKVTYRTQMVLGLLTGFVGLAQFAILAHYINLGGTPPGLQEYGGDLISFMIVGSLFSAIAIMMMNSIKMQIQQEQQRGTLEAIVCSRAGLFQFLLAGGIFGITSSLTSSIVIFAAFGSIFDFEVIINPLGLIISLSVSIICMWLIGLCAGAYILTSKQGEPVTWVVTTLLTLFSGVMYPISVFPDFIVSVLKHLPTAGMLHAIRISLSSGAPTDEVISALTPALICIFVLILVSAKMWNHNLKKVRLDGTLGTY